MAIRIKTLEQKIKFIDTVVKEKVGVDLEKAFKEELNRRNAYNMLGQTLVANYLNLVKPQIMRIH